MTNKTQIEVENKLISIVKQDEQDYICITDMVRDEEGDRPYPQLDEKPQYC